MGTSSTSSSISRLRQALKRPHAALSLIAAPADQEFLDLPTRLRRGLLQFVMMRCAARPTDLIVRPPLAGQLARYATGPTALHNGFDPAVICLSISDLQAFSLSPTILEALNRLRILAGIDPLRVQPDGTIDMPDDLLQYRCELEAAGAFA